MSHSKETKMVSGSKILRNHWVANLLEYNSENSPVDAKPEEKLIDLTPHGSLIKERKWQENEPYLS